MLTARVHNDFESKNSLAINKCLLAESHNLSKQQDYNEVPQLVLSLKQPTTTCTLLRQWNEDNMCVCVCVCHKLTINLVAFKCL